MRVGVNPMKRRRYQSGSVKQGAPLTVATVTYIPEMIGYYRESLDVLRLCLRSIQRHTSSPFDLMVFDNGSCPEVQRFLLDEQAAGRIQFLILSSENVGRVGTWNYLFGAAPGKYIAFTDSDVYFHPGWDELLRGTLDAFPEAGSVSGCVMPHAFTRGYSIDKTLARARDLADVQVEEGQLLPDDRIRRYAEAIGKDTEEYLSLARTAPQYRLRRDGRTAFVSTNHWMFMTRTDVARNLMPFRSQAPLGPGEGVQWETKLNEQGLLQLSASEDVVYHLGNVLLPEWREKATAMGIDVRDPPARVRKHGLASWCVARIPKARGLLRRVSDLTFELVHDSDPRDEGRRERRRSPPAKSR